MKRWIIRSFFIGMCIVCLMLWAVSYIHPFGFGIHGSFRLAFGDGFIQLSDYLVVPMLFPILLSAALLWLVWRRTRAKVKGRAFPVEMGEKQK